MEDRRAAAVWASFCGDALALGVHWEYDARALRQRFGRLEGPVEPPAGHYHAGRKAGDFTHYGDQALVLLASLAAGGAFVPTDFMARWRRLFADYSGYRDGATRAVLANLAAGADPLAAGSQSLDLAGAARIAPLLWALADDPPALLLAAREQTRLTHATPAVMDAAEFFARAALFILEGQAPAAALAAAGRFPYATRELAGWLAQGLASAGEESETVIARLGQACPVAGAFPSVVHLVARHGEDLAVALVENAMAGGDSAGRGLLVACSWAPPTAWPPFPPAGSRG